MACLLVVVASGGCGGDTVASHRVASHSAYTDLVGKLGGELHAHVEFGGSQITDDQLANLDLPETIRSISLRDTTISDLGAAELKRAANLERVDLTNTQITDAALEDLKQLQWLWQVDVAAPNVSPQAFGAIRAHVDRHSSAIKDPSPVRRLPRLPAETESAQPE